VTFVDFTPATRTQLLETLIERARRDERIVAAALVGSLAAGSGDAWSDIDLTFGVADGTRLGDVVHEWTQYMVEHQRAVSLFDIEARGTIYRVFLRDDSLQVDLSFTPGGEARKASPRFRSLFGPFHEVNAVEAEFEQLCGWAVHLAHAARVRIERGRVQQAYWCVTALREHLVQLECARHGLAWTYLKGADELPNDVLAGLEPCIACATEAGELDRALRACVDQLTSWNGAGGALVAAVRPQLDRFRGRA
jgi:hypothetical protein